MLHRDGSVPEEQYEQAKRELPGIIARMHSRADRKPHRALDQSISTLYHVNHGAYTSYT
jgi:hypothetical protein